MMMMMMMMMMVPTGIVSRAVTWKSAAYYVMAIVVSMFMIARSS